MSIDRREPRRIAAPARRARQPAAVLLSASLLAACGGGSEGAANPSPPPAGLNWAPAAVVESGVAPARVEVAIEPAGTATALWEVFAGPPAVFLPRAARSAAGPSAWNPPLTLETVPATGQSFGQALAGAGTSVSAYWLNQNAQSEPVIRTAVFTTAWSAPATLPTQSFTGLASYSGNDAGASVAVWIESVGVDQRLAASRRPAGAAAWTARTLIPGSLSGSRLDASVAVALDAGGTATAVWVQGAAGMPGRIFAASWAAASSAWSVPVQIDAPFGSATAPQVIATAPGRFVAAWEQTINGRTSIHGAVFGPTGWSAPRLLEVDDRGDAGAIRLAASAGGQALAVWMQSDGADFTVWANRFSGVDWTDGQAIVASAAGVERGPPRAALDGAGNAVVVWSMRVPFGAPGRVEYSHRAATAAAWTQPEALSAAELDIGTTPALAMNASGAAVVAWIRYDASAARSVVARRLVP